MATTHSHRNEFRNKPCLSIPVYPKSHSSVEFCRAAADLWVPPVEWPLARQLKHTVQMADMGTERRERERVSIDGPKIYNGRSPIRHHCQSRLANQCFRPHPFREMTIENRDKNKRKKKREQEWSSTPLRPKRLDIGLYYIGKSGSRLYMYTISSQKKLQTVPHFYFLEWKGRTVRGWL